MKTHIVYNGSKWAGQAPDPLEKLLEVLANEPLDPRFQNFHASIATDTLFGAGGDGFTDMFYGNFYRVSHGFSVLTNDPAVISTLIDACKLNTQSDAYRACAREIAAESWKKEARRCQ